MLKSTTNIAEAKMIEANIFSLVGIWDMHDELRKKLMTFFNIIMPNSDMNVFCILNKCNVSLSYDMSKDNVEVLEAYNRFYSLSKSVEENCWR